ncbi:MAG: hypothetical protein WCP92_04160 [bacterium]
MDIDFEFGLGTSGVSEYHFSDKKFYMDIKQHIIQFIKKNPQLEHTVVDNYCDGLSATLSYMKAKEALVGQWEKTTKDLFISLGMPEEFILSPNRKVTSDAAILSTYGTTRKKMLSYSQKKVFKKLLKIGQEFKGFDAAHETKRYIEDMNKNNEEIKKIIIDLQKGKHEIQLDSKLFFLDNGDNLYDEVIERSEYTTYYKEELNLIHENKKKIVQYLKRKYIGL